MNKRTLLGRKAMRGALDSRKRAGRSFDEPICVYDLAEQLGLSVWFQGGGSFGGMYSKTANVVLVPSLRPAPRQSYTCAHELGHWYYGHGSKLDVYEENCSCKTRDDDELLADLFAGHLLMPPGATSKSFRLRNIDPDTCSPTEFYRVANHLQVGYTTLLNHMFWTQCGIKRSSFDRLSKHSPKSIRTNVLGFMDKDPGYLVMADEQWASTSIDLQVGQVACVPPDISIRGQCIEIIRQSPAETFIQALIPGIASIESARGWASFVRVSRKDFEGRSIYRHLEEAEDE